MAGIPLDSGAVGCPGLSHGLRAMRARPDGDTRPASAARRGIAGPGARGERRLQRSSASSFSRNCSMR